MQKDGPTSLQTYPERVDELRHLGEREKRHPQPRGTVPIDVVGGCADSLLEGVRGHEPQQVGDHANGANGAVHSQKEVPARKWRAQVFQGALLHDHGQEDDHGHVDGQRNVNDPPVPAHKLKYRQGVEVFLERGVKVLQPWIKLPELQMNTEDA